MGINLAGWSLDSDITSKEPSGKTTRRSRKDHRPLLGSKPVHTAVLEAFQMQNHPVEGHLQPPQQCLKRPSQAAERPRSYWQTAASKLPSCIQSADDGRWWIRAIVDDSESYWMIMLRNDSSTTVHVIDYGWLIENHINHPTRTGEMKYWGS